MYVDMLGNVDLVALKQVYDTACQTLGLEANADDDRRREEVAKAIISLAKEGELDPIAIHEYVVRMMKGGFESSR
jgi:hypothetical protein